MRRSQVFLTDKVLTFVGQMGKIRVIGGLSGWDKKWIFSFLFLTVRVEPDKLGTLDKRYIVEIVCGRRAQVSVMSSLSAGE
jgi:hypothetical protein